MHQNRNSLTPLRMYRAVHDATLHIHEEINDHPAADLKSWTRVGLAAIFNGYCPQGSRVG